MDFNKVDIKRLISLTSGSVTIGDSIQTTLNGNVIKCRPTMCNAWSHVQLFTIIQGWCPFVPIKTHVNMCTGLENGIYFDQTMTLKTRAANSASHKSTDRETKRQENCNWQLKANLLTRLITWCFVTQSGLRCRNSTEASHPMSHIEMHSDPRLRHLSAAARKEPTECQHTKGHEPQVTVCSQLQGPLSPPLVITHTCSEYPSWQILLGGPNNSKSTISAQPTQSFMRQSRKMQSREHLFSQDCSRLKDRFN